MRIVLFTDSNSVVTTRLVRKTVDLAQKHGEARVVGIVTTRPDAFPSGIVPAARGLMLRTLVALANAEIPLRSVLDAKLDLSRLARRRRISLLVPPSGDPNDPDFIGQTLAGLRPDVALSYYCRQRFGRRLRASFAHAVNFHDGWLPDYRGVMATSFSIFAGEAQSGLTFHHMSGKLDRGAILLRDAVPIGERSTLDSVSRAKARRAAAALPRVLQRLAAGDPGRPQEGDGSYFSVHDWMALTHLADPGNARGVEIRRRIRAFGVVHLTIDGEAYPVTRLRPARTDQRLAFRTADDEVLRPDRFAGLPRLFYRPGRRHEPLLR